MVDFFREFVNVHLINNFLNIKFVYYQKYVPLLLINFLNVWQFIKKKKCYLAYCVHIYIPYINIPVAVDCPREP